MTPGARKALAAAMPVLLLLAAREAGAQLLMGLRPGVWGGSLEAGYQTERQNTHSPDGAADIDSARRRMSERLTIRNEGFYFLDPRLVSGNLGLSFGLMQDRAITDGSASSRNAKLTGYAFDSTFFAEKPYGATLFANRTQNIATQPFGRTDSTYENRGAAARLGEDSFLKNWGMRHFSSALRVEQQHLQETTTSVLGQGFRRDELRDILNYSGHNGFDTADLDWRYEFNDLKNLAYPQGDFQSQAANLNYSLDFGPGLSRRSDTRLSYTNRTGSSRIGMFTGDEHVHVDHYTNLSTDYRYQLMQIDQQAGKTTSQIGSFLVRHELYRNLTTTAQTSAAHTDLPAGTRDSYAGQLDFSYRRGLPWNGTVFVRAGGRNQVDDNRLAASQISVTDEAHAAPSPLGAGAGFLINQAFAIAPGIVVVDTRGGARLPTTSGVDYELVQEGNLVRIVPLPTSAVIQPGDPLAVSYSYEVDPSIKYGTASRRLSAGVDFRWIALSAGHEQSDQKLISGQDSRFLQDLRRDNAQLDLRGAWKSLQGQAGAAYVRYDSTRLAYTQQRYTLLANYRRTRSLALGFNADRTLSEFTLPAHQTDARAMRLTLDWYGPLGLTTTALIGQRVYKDSLLPTETVNEAGLKARLAYGKLDLTSAFTANERMRGGFQAASWRLDFLATRRF